MLSDPRTGRAVSLAVCLAGLAWILGQAVAADALFAAMGYAMHAATLLAIFALLAGAASAWLFGRYAQIREDLLAGRCVVATWIVDARTFERFAPGALADDRREKRQALIAVWVLIAVVFGAFGLYDPEAALPMASIGAAVAALLGGAMAYGGRVARAHWRFRTGRVILGTDGLLFNDVLHVWGLPGSRLVGASLTTDPPALLIAYRFWTRLGPQTVMVPLPVPPDAAVTAATAAAALDAIAHPGRRRRPGSRA